MSSPPPKCHSSICIVPRYAPLWHACTPKTPHTRIASWKLHHFAVVWKLHPSITIPPITPQVSCFVLFFFSPSSLPLTILVFSLHFNLALNCQAWIALWTAWGGQAGRRCVWMHESLCYHHLFSFSSPSGAVRSQTRYHSPPSPPTESQHTTRKWYRGRGRRGRVRGLWRGGWGGSAKVNKKWLSLDSGASIAPD